MLGASIRACKRNGRHIMAFEEDYAIFDAIIAPLCIVNTTLACAHVGWIASLHDDDDGPIRKVVKCSRISK